MREWVGIPPDETPKWTLTPHDAYVPLGGSIPYPANAWVKPTVEVVLDGRKPVGYVVVWYILEKA